MTHIDSIMIRESAYDTRYQYVFWGFNPAKRSPFPTLLTVRPFKKTKVWPGPLPIDTSRNYCQEEHWTFMKFSTMVRWLT